MSPSRRHPWLFAALIAAFVWIDRPLHALGPSIPTVASFEELQDHVDRAWTNNLSAILVPPGADFEAHVGLVAFTTNLTTVIEAFFPTSPPPQDGVVLYPLRVEESEVPSLLRSWFTPSGAATNTVPPVEYDPEAWVLAQHPIPTYLATNRQAAWIADWKLTDRQRLHLRLIAADDVPAFLAVVSNRAAAAGTTLTEEDLGVINIRVLPGGDTAEILLHTPEEVDRVGLYQTETLLGEIPPWEYLGEIPRQSDPLVVLHPLHGERKHLLFANHLRDSDGDGLPDAMEELIFRTHPGWVDTDGDGLSDWEEALVHGTDPTAWDSDGDGLDDRLEIQAGYDPQQANTDLTLLDYARMQGVPDMVMIWEAIYPSPFGSMEEIGRHTLTATAPSLGPTQVPAQPQAPAHVAQTTYAATELLGGRVPSHSRMRLVAYQEEDIPHGYCNAFQAEVRYGRIRNVTVVEADNADATHGVGGQGQTMSGLACFDQPPYPTTGALGVQVAIEPALYELTQITPTNVFAAAGGSPITFTAVVQKPFPYYAGYTGPIRWDIVPAEPDGPRFVSNTNTIFATAGGNLTVQVNPGTNPGVYALEARIPGRPKAAAELSIFKIEMITPAGDPVTAAKQAGDGQNEFTYSTTSPGVLTLDLKARVTPSGIAHRIKDQCFFTVDAIAGSTLAWDAANPGGKPTASGNDLLATVTFTGLPASNTAFGSKNAAIHFNADKQDEKNYEVFFPRDAANNPGGSDPNWFYYWSQVYVNANVHYVAAAAAGRVPAMTNWRYTGIPDKSRIEIGNGHPAKFKSYGVGEEMSGIDCYVSTVIHEEKHVAQIAAADAFLPTNGTDSFRFGWSWNQATHNHWTKGPDEQWGVATVDDDGNGTVDDAAIIPPFEPGNGDDVSLDHATWLWWPSAWALPGGVYATIHPIEGEAVKAADDAMNENDYGSQDWGDPGKNHQTINKWDD